MSVESIHADNIPLPSLPAQAAAQSLAQKIRGRVSTSDADRLAYSRDMWTKGLLWIRRGLIPRPPDAIVWPRDEQEVSWVIQEARQRKLAIVPFGAGSGVCGGTWALKGGIALDLKFLDGLQVDEENLTAEAQAGIIGEALERRLNRQGYSLGHFPSSIYMSTLGGWLAARSAGQCSSKYGKIEDMALSVRAVLGTGELLQTPERPFAGPDLTALLIGSEGTLCAFTAAKLRICRVAQHREFRGFMFASVADGLDAIRRLFRAGLRPAVVRLYDPFDTALVANKLPSQSVSEEHPTTNHRSSAFFRSVLRNIGPKILERPALLNKMADLVRNCLLILIFEGERNRAADEMDEAAAICLAGGGVDRGEAPSRAWFEQRYAVSYKMSKIIDAGCFVDTMEVATTWDKVQDVYDGVRQALSPLVFVMCHFSHAYLEGCSLYFSFVGGGRDEDQQMQRYEAAWRAALAAAQKAGANLSHHHGIGILKQEEFAKQLGSGRLLLGALKDAFDPDGIMNPEKLSFPRDSAPTTTGSSGESNSTSGDAPALSSDSKALEVAPGMDRIEVPAFVTVADVEQALNRHGLSLGPLSPRSLEMTVGRFLEGPSAGLHPVASGRLESLALSVRVLLPNGTTYFTHPSPRHAVGPALEAFFAGAGGSAGVIRSAVLKVLPLPTIGVFAVWWFSGPELAISAIRRGLASGSLFERVNVWSEELRWIVRVHFWGSTRAVRRDIASIEKPTEADPNLAARRIERAPSEGGVDSKVSETAAETELTWTEILPLLREKRRLELYRLSLQSALVAVENLDRSPLDISSWSVHQRDLLARVSAGTGTGGASA